MLSSGLGGVYPKGIPVGTVTGVVGSRRAGSGSTGCCPAANPGSAAHVLILVAPTGDLARAFPSDSRSRPMRLDSLDRLRQADSVAQAARSSPRAARATRWPRTAPGRGRGAAGGRARAPRAAPASPSAEPPPSRRRDPAPPDSAR